MLFKFDRLRFRNIRYVRYIDDIKLLAKAEVPLKRALLTLDLISKNLGLVPQAQKINLGKIERVEDILKTILSEILEKVEGKAAGSQKTLYKMFCKSIQKEKQGYTITDTTTFKYSLKRMNPRRDVLKRIATMLNQRPDCSFVFAEYLKKFPASKEAADILLDTLHRDPTYDAVAANYIEAMDVCEPEIRQSAYRRVIHTAKRRSIEKSILLRIAILTFRGRRSGPKDALRLLQAEKNPIVKNIVMHRLYGDDDDTPYKINDCLGLLQKGVTSDNDDFARCCAFNLIYHASSIGELWEAPPM